MDLDNTPHVLFFLPIIDELQDRGHQVLITVRDAFQVVELATAYGLTFQTYGKHAGKNKIRKALSLLTRSTSLLPFAIRNRPDLSISHGARSQLMVSNLLRIPTVEFIDYEHVDTPPLCLPKWEIAPECYDQSFFRVSEANALRYPGIKENVYLQHLPNLNDPAKDLGLSNESIVVTVRPPATEAHYHNPEAERLLGRLLERIDKTANAIAIILPRNQSQTQALSKDWRPQIASRKFIIPQKATDTPSLLAISDLVVGGGGTMTREACALGIPSYSFFRGPKGAIDAFLERAGQLVMIEKEEEMQTSVRLEKRPKTQKRDRTSASRNSLESVVTHLESILS